MLLFQTAAREMRKIEAQLALPPAYIAAITGLGQSDVVQVVLIQDTLLTPFM